jgi:hypothetical protein
MFGNCSRKAEHQPGVRYRPECADVHVTIFPAVVGSKMEAASSQPETLGILALGMIASRWAPQPSLDRQLLYKSIRRSDQSADRKRRRFGSSDGGPGVVQSVRKPIRKLPVMHAMGRTWQVLCSAVAAGVMLAVVPYMEPLWPVMVNGVEQFFRPAVAISCKNHLWASRYAYPTYTAVSPGGLYFPGSRLLFG